MPVRPYVLNSIESVTDCSDIQGLASNDPVCVRVVKAARFGHRNKIAAGVMVAIAIGAVAGSNLTSNEPEEPTYATKTARVASSVVDLQSLAQITQDAQITLPPDTPTAESEVGSIVQQPDATATLNSQYLEELERLRSTNASLHQEVDTLGAETTNLNYELLQLELAMTAQESELPQVEATTVYNFVDVAIGSDFEGNSVQPNNYAAPSREDDYYSSDDRFSEEATDYYSDGQAIGLSNSFVAPGVSARQKDRENRRERFEFDEDMGPQGNRQ